MAKEQEKDTHLEDAAAAAGAVPVDGPQDDPFADPFDGIPTIEDRLGDQKIHFYEDLPRKEWTDLINARFVILDAELVPEWDNPRFGQSSRFCLLKIKTEKGEIFTTLAGGDVIYKRVEKLIKDRAFPCLVRLVQAPGETGGRPYYQFK